MHLPAVLTVFLKHGLGAHREVLRILLPVAGGDGVQGHFIGVGIDVVVGTRHITGGHGGAVRIPGGNTAVGVARHFGAHGGQGFAQLRGLFGADSGLCAPNRQGGP